MKRFIPVLTLIILASSLSCKKLVEKKQREAIIDAMTSGQWMVEQYFDNGSNVTDQFYDYKFQFYENGTVKGMLGTEVANGTWAADTDKYTITSNFPAATNPVSRLNFTWAIKDTDWDYVNAETTTQAGKNILHLRKIP
jgi:hypothetical protein